MTSTVFIPTGNRASSLRKILDSLVNQTCKDFEVIIVDYKSGKDTFTTIEQYRDKIKIHVINQKEKGLAKAANLALKKTTGDIFIRTDDDVVMDKNWLKAIQDTFLKDKQVGGVTGPTVIPSNYLQNRDLFSFEEKFKNGSLLWKFIGKIYFDYFMEGNPYRVSHWTKCGAFTLGSNFVSAQKTPYQEVNNLEACNWSVKTALLKKVGGFDETYTGVGEYHEADAAFKIKNLGFKLVFNPKAMLNHCPSQDGFFHERPSSYSRMINFIRFYITYIKLDSVDKLNRFSLYLLFLNCYYSATAVRTRQVRQLGALPATFIGLYNALWQKKR